MDLFDFAAEIDMDLIDFEAEIDMDLFDFEALGLRNIPRAYRLPLHL